MSYFDFKTFCLMLIICAGTYKVHGADIVRTNDHNTNYKMKVLTLALEKTRDSYGDFEIKVSDIPTTTKRAILEVASGKTINLFVAVTTNEWEEKTLPILIPLRRGLLNYRLLVTTKNTLKKFSNIENIQHLKKLAAGLRVGWATTDIFKAQKFSLYELESLDGIYNMLEREAIDYIPRGINEAYDDLTNRQADNLIVEPNLVLYLPAPTYFMVSPQEPRLAKRIEAGLEMMVSDGSLKAIFYQFFADDIKKANINSRKMIIIPNPFQPKTIPFERRELWFKYDQESQKIQ